MEFLKLPQPAWVYGARQSLIALICLAGLSTAASLPAQTVTWDALLGTAPGNPRADLGCNDSFINKETMVIDSTGHVIVAGCANDGHATVAIAIKYAPDGSRVWTSHRFGEVVLAASRGVAVDAAGDVYMTGYVFSGSNSRDIVTAKYDGATGAMLWGKRFDSAGQNDEPQALVLDSQGDVIVAGFVTRTDGNQDLLVMKLAGGNGDQLWLTQHDGSAGGDDMAVAVTVDAADNVVTTGRSFGTLNLEMVTLKLSGASGNLLWLTHYGESLDQFIYATSLVVGSSGDVFVAGVNANEGFAHDYVVLRYDGGNGDELWVATEPGPEADPALPPRITLGANDDVFLAGSIGPRDDTDFLVQRYAGTTGNLLWSDRFDGVAAGSDQARSLAVDSSGNLLVMGAATGLDGDTEILTLKLAGGSGTEQWRNALDTDAESDFAFSMALDTAGNAVLAGSSATGSATDFLVAKLDGSTGTTRWNATEGPLDLAVRFGCGDPERASRAMAVDALGNTFVAGCRYNGRNHDILTAKLSPEGHWLWHTVFDGGATDTAVALALDVAGNLIVAGETFDAPTRQDSLVLKYDSGSGALIWSARYTGPTPTSSQSLGDVIVDHNGDVILTGMTSTLGMGFSAANIKFASATGEVLWSTQIDGLSGSMKDVQVDDAGDVYVAGMLGQDLAVAKLSGATGGQIWLARSGDFLGFNGTAKALAIDELGAVAVIGEVFRPQTSADLVTAKLDGMDGSLLWAAYSIGAGNDYDFANAVSVDAAGNVIVLGQHYIAAGDSNLVTIKYDGSNGAVLWERHYDGPGQGTDVALDLALTDTGDAMITGQSQSACAYSQYTTIRYNGLTGDEIWVTRSLPTGMAGGGIRVATDGSARVAGTALLDRGHQIGVVRIDEGGVPDRILRDDFESGVPALLQCME